VELETHRPRPYSVVMSAAATWGSTAEERAQPFPCDAHLVDADASLFRAVTIDAAPRVVFRWLCQLRAAPYSYDLLDNFGRTSPRALTPGLEDLAVGQRVMTIFRLVEFERDRHITLTLSAGAASRIFGAIAVSYVVTPDATGGTRLVVKLRVKQRGPLAGLRNALLAWGDVVMMRKQLLTLKALAETTPRG
jgi:hypothetical protein